MTKILSLFSLVVVTDLDISAASQIKRYIRSLDPRATGPMNDLDVICRGSGSVASFERYTNWLPQQPSVARPFQNFNSCRACRYVTPLGSLERLERDMEREAASGVNVTMDPETDIRSSVNCPSRASSEQHDQEPPESTNESQ
jgi:hypothetical protein